MRVALSGSVLIATGLTVLTACGSGSATRVEGDWALTLSYDVATPGGTFTCAFEQDGAVVSGRCDEFATLTGLVRGTAINFDIAGSSPQDAGAPKWTTAFAGTVQADGGGMRGTVSLSGKQGRFTAVRRTVSRGIAPPSA